MINLAAIAYILITVTYGAEVHHSNGFESLDLCEQAKSLALTGMTIEQNKAADEAYAKARKDWEDAHPWRDPQNDWEREMAKVKMYGAVSNGGPISWAFNGEGKIRDMMSASASPTYDPSRGEGMDFIRGAWAPKNKSSVKHAECVIDPAAR
jgi:hypothetical protein